MQKKTSISTKLYTFYSVTNSKNFTEDHVCVLRSETIAFFPHVLLSPEALYNIASSPNSSPGAGRRVTLVLAPNSFEFPANVIQVSVQTMVPTLFQLMTLILQVNYLVRCEDTMC